ncbi:pectin acetylesterase-family hydrolase [uncultured Paraglaciecola sp.]|uniref:pectin acetylesterase-family hydrolase n=1 Tax=uncultured Paraglaciecola sp. TaxID=1765024 RepID=UPI0030DC39C2
MFLLNFRRIVLLSSGYLTLSLFSQSAFSAEILDQTTKTNAGSTWQVVEPGGDTQCSDGSPYKFHVKPGKTDKLFVFFNGGGACWNAQTCDVRAERKAFVPRADLAHNDPSQHNGIFDLDNPENPVKDWSMVFAPYCTGDVHLGSAQRKYVTADKHEFEIKHAGAANSQAVLQWVEDNMSPEKVVIAGASAGALAAPIYAGRAATMFPNADVLSFADGAAGYRSNQVPKILEQWSVYTPLDINKYAGFQKEMTSFYSFYGVEDKHHSKINFALYDSAEDKVQVMFKKMLGDTDVLVDAIGQTYKSLRSQVAPLSYYLARGDVHTILRFKHFYSTEVDGVRFVDWFNNLLNSRFPDVVDCRSLSGKCQNDALTQQ